MINFQTLPRYVSQKPCFIPTLCENISNDCNNVNWGIDFNASKRHNTKCLNKPKRMTRHEWSQFQLSGSSSSLGGSGGMRLPSINSRRSSKTRRCSSGWNRNSFFFFSALASSCCFISCGKLMLLLFITIWFEAVWLVTFVGQCLAESQRTIQRFREATMQCGNTVILTCLKTNRGMRKWLKG